jgi:YD repeat-containing protein
VIVKYAKTSDEYVEAQRIYRTRVARGRVFFRNLYGLACLTVALGVYSRLSGARWWGDLLFLIAGLLLLERTILWRLRAAAKYRSTPSLGETVELKIEESNILRAVAAGSTEIRWANILACRETKNLFLLRTAPDDVLVIPKRAFSPGDLYHFKELRQKELIVKTTRENPDIVLLRFMVSWGLISATVVALFIGYVHNFLTSLPRNQSRNGSFTAAAPRSEKSPPVPASELRGSGSVYVVQLGTVQSVSVTRLLDDFYKRYGLQLHLLPTISPPTWARNMPRKQLVAEDLVTAMKLAYPSQAAESGSVMIGITDEDMYISELNWTYAFSFRSEERFAVISSAHLSEPGEDSESNKPVSADVLQKRAAKVLIRDVGILHYRLQPSSSYTSILYRNIDEASDLDGVGEDYLESDVMVRAERRVTSGDPCFILRHYTMPERDHPEVGTLTGCSGYYKEPGLETVQIDLSYGLLLDQRTDFLVKDRIPLELTRVLRTQDDRSRAFGIGGNHNLNVFLVGDKWPFTWMDLVLEHGGRSHFRRSNWGFGYWDARYTNRDVNRNMYSGSTIDWAWPGWKLKRYGMTYLFPDPNGASRPEQGAVIGIQNYGGLKLALNRDAAGNLLQAHSPDGHELDFKYDRSNRVIEVDEKDGGRFEYSYDATGHLAQVKDADQNVTEYRYDESGRMSRIVQAGKEICSLTYDDQGRVHSETIAGGRTYLFKYSRGNVGTGSQVDILDSAAPVRRIRISPVEYTLEVLATGQR